MMTSYDELIQSMPHVIFEADHRGRVTLANCQALATFGYRKEDLPENPDVFQVIHDSDRIRARRDFRMVLAGRPVEATQYTAQKTDGSTFTLLVLPWAATREAGRVGVRGIAVEMTGMPTPHAGIPIAVGRVTQALEEERKRIARELHDDTAQSLAALSLEIQAMRRDVEGLSSRAAARLQQLTARADAALEGIRRLCRELRPEALEQLGFVPAVEVLASDLRTEAGIDSRAIIRGTERRLLPGTELALYRIAQEAFSNARRHARATEVVIALRFNPKSVTLIVSDNGIGFEVPDRLADLAVQGKLGLSSMRERARLHDARFTIESSPGHGTTVSVRMPA